MLAGKQGIAAAVAAAILMGCASAIAADKEDVNARRADGSTPLQWAAFSDDVAEAKRLIAAGADVKATNNYGISAMLLAADIASTELIQLLLKTRRRCQLRQSRWRDGAAPGDPCRQHRSREAAAESRCQGRPAREARRADSADVGSRTPPPGDGGVPVERRAPT